MTLPRRHAAAAVLVVLLLACDSGADEPVPGEVGDEAAPEPSPGEIASAPASGSESGGEAEAASPLPGALPPSPPFPTGAVMLVGPDGERTDVEVYVAADTAARQRGLMGVDDLPEDAGMIFLFPEERDGAFFMFQTLIPLTIAFFDDAGEVVDVLDMEPCESDDSAECERYRPDGLYTSALEVNLGYLDEVGVEPGWRIELDDGLPAPS